jgi:glycosyltransferase involved in cell wall biosynthesis
MNVNPLVSIISPAYNHEKYIADCIKSVQAQTYQNWEMIIIDDGSTDSTFYIAASYATEDHRIKVFNQKNIGIFRLAESYNLALSKCSGKYVAILECDDLWLPGKLEKQVKLLENNTDYVLSWGKANISSADLSHTYSVSPDDESDPDLYFNRPPGKFLERLMKSGIPALTIVIRKEVLAETGGFLQGHGLPLVDMPTLVELVMKGEFGYINEPLGHWRISPVQVTKTYTADMTTGFYSLFIETLNKYPEICERYGLSRKKIDDYFMNRLVISYSRAGRYKLIRKDFKGARKDYVKSIFNFGFRQPLWKLRSITGYFFSLLQMDIEWLAKLIGNDSYK